MPMNKANNPITEGKLRVKVGIRLPWTDLLGLEGRSVLVRSVPHTMQRSALSLMRVPQVGHNLVGFEGFSGLIFHYPGPQHPWGGPGLGGLYQIFRWYTPFDAAVQYLSAHPVLHPSLRLL